MLKTLLLAIALGVVALPAQTQVDPLEGLWQGYDGEWVRVSRQLVSLAEAIPAEKCSWRPAPGVAPAAKFLCTLPLPTSFCPVAQTSKCPQIYFRDPEKSVTQKPPNCCLVEEFARCRQNRSRNSEPRRHRGRDVPADIVHADEHVGQLVAYARMNGITPPRPEASGK